MIDTSHVIEAVIIVTFTAVITTTIGSIAGLIGWAVSIISKLRDQNTKLQKDVDAAHVKIRELEKLTGHPKP